MRAVACRSTAPTLGWLPPKVLSPPAETVNRMDEHIDNEPTGAFAEGKNLRSARQVGPELWAFTLDGTVVDDDGVSTMPMHVDLDTSTLPATEFENVMAAIDRLPDDVVFRFPPGGLDS